MTITKRLFWGPWLCATVAGAWILIHLAGCGQPSLKTAVITMVPTDAMQLALARRESRFVRLPMSLKGPAFVTLEASEAGFLGKPEEATVLYEITHAGTISSPAAEQLTGESKAPVDVGSVLVPGERAGATGDGKIHTFRVGDGSSVWLHLSVPVAAAAGHHAVTLGIAPAAPVGKGQTSAKTAVIASTVHVDLEVVDITLPLESPIAAVATTTTAELTQLDGPAFANLPAAYLDRADPDHRRAVARLDAIVIAAHARGVALFVEDLAPGLKLDSVGQVHLDWEAYDRTMFPYMDGSAFADHTGLTSWLVPAPPRRIRDTPAQLRQYWQGCLEHLQQKNWKALPIFLHSALVSAQSAEGDVSTPDLRAQVLGVLRQDIDKNAAVMMRPAFARGQDLGRPCLWTLDDSDRQLPPAGALATPASVRVWPWMCQARDVRGLVWRHGVGSSAVPNVAEEMGTFPLLALESAVVVPTLRLAWLTAGLTDCSRAQLVSRRSDPRVAAEILAGVVGRSGLAASIPDSFFGARSAGYLYAGWPQDEKVWEVLPAMLDQLIVSGDPGTTVKVAPDDLLYLATKMWLAQAHRPVARGIGFNFKLDAGRDGSLLETQVALSVENPIQLPVAMDVSWPELPGDMRIVREPAQEVAPVSVSERTVRATGHLESLTVPGHAYPMQFQERVGGAMLSLPVMLPIYRAMPVHSTLKVDGQVSDWPEDPRVIRGVYAPMAVALRYANRVDLLAGRIAVESAPAQVRWTYDSDWVYAFIDCPQSGASDDRTGEWPGGGPGGPDGRWWGSDGVQVQIAGGPRLEPGIQVIQMGIKPSGTVLMSTATLVAGQRPRFENGPPKGPALRYAIRNTGKGYSVELAIPRKWLGKEYDKDTEMPLWRVNVMRYQEQGHVSTSWSGPIINDADLAMMGLLTGLGD